jgi:UDP-glucose 4-epimerase
MAFPFREGLGSGSMNILVTGGAGFIGSHVVDGYLAEGHEVSVVDNLSTGRKSNLNPHARFFNCDIRDRDALENVFHAGTYDVVNHHAAQTDVRRSVSDPVYDASVNILGFLGLLECCARHRVSKVILASTGGAVYGEQEVFPANEDHPTRPMSPYGTSKLSSEQYLSYYCITHGLHAVILRYANVYGSRQNPHGEAGVVAIFTATILRGDQPVINGDGKQTRDYVYVGDVVRANLIALQCQGFHIFNVGTGIETNVQEIFELIVKTSGTSVDATYGPAKVGEQRRSVLDTTKIARMFGWRPSVKLEEGLVATVAYLKNEAMGIS